LEDSHRPPPKSKIQDPRDPAPGTWERRTSWVQGRSSCHNRPMTERPGLESDRVDTGTGPSTRTGRVTRHAGLIVFILLLAGVFDAISGNPVDAVLLVAVGALLAVFPDRPVYVPSGAGHRVRLGTLAVAVAAAAAFAIVVGRFERYTWPVTIGVLVPGITALTFVWRGTRRRDPGPRLELRQVAPWMAVFVALGLFELVNLLLQPGLTIDSYDHPTLSVLSDAILDGHLGRSLGLFVWLLLGVYLVDR